MKRLFLLLSLCALCGCSSSSNTVNSGDLIYPPVQYSQPYTNKP